MLDNERTCMRATSPASDVYGLGATLFELVTHRTLLDLTTGMGKTATIFLELQATNLQEKIDRAIDEHVQNTEWNRLLKLMLRADPKERISAAMAAAILRGMDRRDHTERLLDAASLHEVFPQGQAQESDQ